MKPTKLTPDMIDALVADVSYSRHGTLTVCVLDLANGAQVTGTSNVIDPTNYDAIMGEKVAFENAKGKIWELEGYAMKTRDMVPAVAVEA